jgi:hypothetical protein
MPRHFGIRKRKELKGGRSNIDKLAEDFAKEIQLGKAEDAKPTLMNPTTIKKKFSI